MNLLTVAEAAERCRVSPRLLRKLWSEDKGPPRLRIGQRVLVEADALNNWLASRVEQRRTQIATAA